MLWRPQPRVRRSFEGAVKEHSVALFFELAYRCGCSKGRAGALDLDKLIMRRLSKLNSQVLVGCAAGKNMNRWMLGDGKGWVSADANRLGERR
jgi:hypothetical protein